MRALSLLLPVVLLFAGPTKAGCPPMTPQEAVRAAEYALRPWPKPITAINTEEFKPYCLPGPKAPMPLLCKGGKGIKLTLTEVRSVDTTFRAEFEYRADFITTGSEDRWRAGVICGDCEDYSLTLAERLHAAGQGGQFMRLMLWGPKEGGGHATLLVETADAGVVEIGNGPAATEGPLPYNAARGTRFATIRFDGKRILEPMPGYMVTYKGGAIEPAR